MRKAAGFHPSRPARCSRQRSHAERNPKAGRHAKFLPPRSGNRRNRVFRGSNRLGAPVKMRKFGSLPRLCWPRWHLPALLFDGKSEKDFPEQEGPGLSVSPKPFDRFDGHRRRQSWTGRPFPVFPCWEISTWGSPSREPPWWEISFPGDPETGFTRLKHRKLASFPSRCPAGCLKRLSSYHHGL